MIKFSFNTSLSNILEDEYVLKTIRETLNDQVSISNNLIIIDSGFTFESNLNELIDEIDKRNKTRPSKSLSIEPTLLSQKILGNLTSNNKVLLQSKKI
ncbi:MULTISPECIES: hypothetical protein [unclassified Mammaliicoccus]|uniref:hypothetical protein n=1 Tax=unclassified Mammaliicoccus TaxID=2803851 RepID=UPI001EFC086B|nr:MULTISPECIES: hypothetical protein [unclassified Mammaliicoccus]